MENNSADVSLGLHEFLERMRQPSASDFVKSIKSFIVSFLNNARDPETDSALVQEFLSNMETAFRAHPLWAGCSEEELDSAGEGLEKYVMTKLFTHVFASSPNDVKVDEQLAEKISLVQQFVRPENLDIKPAFQNESSWLLAQKELQKINMYKAPRDKLVCILSCCKVISNLLFNASIASNENPPGADEFLPVLIYVTIKANPPQLHSNLLYIQRYRRQSRLVSEAAYFLTNMLSAESFISNIDAKSLSMEESEFEKHMEFSRALLSALPPDVDSLPNHNHNSRNIPREIIKTIEQPLSHKKGRDSSVPTKPLETRSYSEGQLLGGDVSSMPKSPSLSDIENRGATMLLKEDQANQVFREYPYLFARLGDLTINNVEDLLNNYKQLVVRYICLSKGLGSASTSGSLPRNETHVNDKAETMKDHLDAETANPQNETQERELEKHTALTDDSHAVSLTSEEITELNHPREEVAVPLEVAKDDTSS